MVKSYNRYDQEKCFGLITSQSNIVWLPPSESQSSSSQGRALTSGLEEILVWDIKTGELLQRFKDGLNPGESNSSTTTAPSPVTYLTHHQQTNLVGAGYMDGTIKIWDLASQSVLITFQGHKSGISQLKFDRNGTRLCSGSNDSTVILWDLIGEEGLFKLKGHKGPIHGLQFLSQGDNANSDELDDFLLSCSKDGLIKLWELKSQQCIETHLAHSNECWSMGVNKEKNLLITSGNKDQVKVWDINLQLKDGEKIKERGQFDKQSKARSNEIEFKYLKQGTQMFELFSVQNSDRTIEIFRIRSEEEIKKGINKRSKRLKEKGLSQEEILQSIQESEINILISSFTTLRTTAKIKSSQWINNPKKLEILNSLTNNTIEYDQIVIPDNVRKAQPTDLITQKLHTIDSLGHRFDIRAMDISPNDNKLLATASNGELKIWNISTFNVIRSFVLEGGYALCCKFLPGGSLIVVGFKNGDLELYDLATSSLVDRVEKAHKLSDSDAAIWSLDLSPDGKTLVTGGNDKCVKFWNFKIEQELVPGTDHKISSLKFHHKQTLELNEDVLCVKISSDAKFLAISLLNNNVQVVFLDSLKLFLTLYGHKLPVLSIDISQDSKLIITSSADKNVKIWGLDFGDCHKSIFAHQDSIMNVKFIGDSHNFFSSGKDGLIKYWDGDKFECIQKLPAHQSEVWCMAISNDGLFMCSTSHDHSIRLWSATNDQVFLEEEREKELDEQYENTLLNQLEDEPQQLGDEDVDESSKVSKQTMETLKSGEKLIEALDIGIEDVEAIQEYEMLLKQGKKISKPTPNSILLAFNMTGSQYVLDTLLKIKAAQLDDALLVLPFSYTLKLLRFIEIWTNESNISSNFVNLSIICRVLFFIVNSNLKEFSNQKDPHLKNQLMKVKEQLRKTLNENCKVLGVNTQGLKFVKQQWKLTHVTEFIDQEEQNQFDEKHSIKRSYQTI